MEVLSPVQHKKNYLNESIINLKKGLPGFDEYKKYIIKDIEEGPFKLLQSIDDANIGFVLVSPFEFEVKYEIELSENIISNLKIEDPIDVALYSIVTLNSNVEKITANLKAPLVINIKENLGEQFIMDTNKYKTKHPLKKG